jgi:hypothetical protein
MKLYNETTVLNSYKGGVYQQTTSGLAVTNQVGLFLLNTRAVLTVVFRDVIRKVLGVSQCTDSSTNPEPRAISRGPTTTSLPGRYAVRGWDLIPA